MHPTPFFSGFRFPLFVTAVVVLAGGVFGDRPRAQQNTISVRDTNFDIRSASPEVAAAYRNRVALPASAFATLDRVRDDGLAQLRAEFPALETLQSPLSGALEVVGIQPGGGFLTGPDPDHVGALRGFFAAHADAYGLTAAQVQSLELVADYTNPSGNMSWVEFEQRINGVPVFQGLVRGGFTRNGELARVTGPLASGLNPAALPRTAAIDGARAVSLAAAHVGWNVPETTLVLKGVEPDSQRLTFEGGSMADAAKAWPVYFPLAPGVARLAWATEIWGDPDVFLVVLDAEDGTVLFRKILTDYQSQSATYNVYTDDSPAPLSPSTVLPGSGTQAPFIGRTSVTVVGNEAPNTFNNLGWMTDGLNETDGNNVRAGVDLVAPDGIESTVSGSNRIFNFQYDPQTDDPATSAYRSGEVTDMFYWTNRYHDSLYLLGFTESARNFQANNFGRGGAGNDRINAEGQDFSGTSNANFSTPPDGSPGRMQMYIFPGPTPHRTSAIDHDVLLHELTHGTSNRLHNNASGLASTVSRGMGEGWSDFYARTLLSSAAENIDGIYPSGGWVTYQITPGFVDNYYYGIRRFPYAVKTTVGANGKPHNPLTFADIDPVQINLSDGAFPPAFVGSANEVHNIGEVWCMALLEVRARFITRLGFATGNQRFLQFVTDGMKLDPTNPTPLTGRDAILAAAAAGGGTADDIVDLWAGFAARGMGVWTTFNPDTFAVVENFSKPGDPVPSFLIDDVSVVEGNSGTAGATFTVRLVNGGSSNASVTWATADATATAPGTPVTSSSVINIPSAGQSTPYPSSLVVSGLSGSVTHLRVRLNGLAHSWPGDIGALLVSPAGQRVMLMSGAWNNPVTATPVSLTFADGAPQPPTTGVPVTETYRPTNYRGATFPGVPGPYSTSLAALNGTDPNGTWNLYVFDFVSGSSGTISGYSLIFSNASSDDYVASSGTLTFAPGGPATQTFTVPVLGDVIPEVDERFVVNLSQPTGGAIILDSQAVGTIFNDDAGLPPPTVVTNPAANVAPTSARLNGGVIPNGLPTLAWFEYGLTASFGSSTPQQSLGSGTSMVPFFADVGQLSCGATYYFRAKASNVGGTTNGPTETVTPSPCLPPTVTTGIPTAFTASGATLNGTANPNGFATTAWFEYGPTASYGSSTPIWAIAAGTQVTAIGAGAVTGLTCGTIYHFRVVAVNAIGRTNGSDRIFSPPCPGTIDSSLYVVANDTSAVRVQNAATLASVATIPMSTSSVNFDVVVTPDQSLAFAARTDGIWVVDLRQSPPALAVGVNPIPTPTGMPFVEDLALTSEGRFLVASDGSTAAPIAVINTATRAVVGTFSVTPDHNSVEVCDDGSVLTTSLNANAVKRLTISQTGTLTDTGQALTLPAPGVNNAVCAPGGRTGVVVLFSGQMLSFLLNGMTAVSTQVVPGGSGVTAAFSPNGTSVFVRSLSTLTAYAFDPATGVIRTAAWSTALNMGNGFFGVDQVAVDPTGRRVYATTPGFIASLDTATGALNGGGVAASPSGIALRRATAGARADFDGDRKTDLAIYRPSTGTWWVLRSSSDYTTYFSTQWGIDGDIPVAGDYDGDGKTDLAIYRPSTGTWWVLRSSSDYTTYFSTQWGIDGDIPVAGDYDGDGKTDLAIYRPSTGTWWVLRSSSDYTTYFSTQWGIDGDIPVAGDYDGDRKTDLAIYRPSTGTWWVLRSSSDYTTYFSTQWGIDGDIPVAGDYDGDGKTDLAIYRPSTGTWWVLRSSSDYTTYFSTQWGIDGDIPVAGDYDGDGKTDLAIYRPSTGTWWVLQSSSDYTTYSTTQWGIDGDIPIVGN